MVLIDRYIFRATFGAFMMVLVSLTAVIWITQALRGIDLMTSQGQSILVFIGITGLAIPSLILVIAPLALVIAVAYVLNKLATDSEIIVMNAAGLRPWRLFGSFLLVGIVVSLMITFISFYLAPAGLRRLKTWSVEISSDVVTNVLQTGKFLQIDAGLTIFVRERQPGGRLVGVFIDDKRDPNEHVSILADHGFAISNTDGSFLILEDGSLHRFEAGKRDPQLIVFESYAFDMSKFRSSSNLTYNSRERYFWELIHPNPDDPLFKLDPGQFRADFHDRVAAPLYPIVFVTVAFAFLGAPRTTRQSRAFSITTAITAVTGLRVVGFACAVLTLRTPVAAYVQYLLLAATLLVGADIIRRASIIEPPAALTKAMGRLTKKFST